MGISFNIFDKFKFNPANYRVLIVEDSKSLNEVIYNKFLEFGYQCYRADTLTEAQSILENNSIDFLLLDINLPDGNGYDIINKYSLSKLKIFVLTSQDDEQMREISFQKGVIDYIVKDRNFFLKLDGISANIEKIIKNMKSNILVVDDSIVIREQLSEILKNRNYNVLTLDNVDDILDTLQNNKIDLMLLDVNIHDKNGIDFLNSNRSKIIDELDIPVIIVSGSNDTHIVREGLRAGAKDIIRKPYIIEEIVLKVDVNIDYKRKQDELNYFQFTLEQYKHTIEKNLILYTVDKYGFIKSCNQNFTNLTGYTKDEIIKKNHEIFKSENEKFYVTTWNQITSSKKSWKGLIINAKKDGKPYFAETVVNPIKNKQGEIIEYIFLLKDVSKEKLLENYVKKLTSQK